MALKTMTETMVACAVTLLLLGLCTISAAAPDRVIDTYAGETTVMRFHNISRIAIGNPEVADVGTFPERPDELLLNAKSPGVTSLSVWDASPSGFHEYEVRVSDMSSRLEQQMFQFKNYTLYWTKYDRSTNSVILETNKENVENIIRLLAPVLGEDGFSVDQTRNRVLMLGTQTELNLAEKILEDLDLPKRQLEIEARIVEITDTDLKRLGNYLSHQKGGVSITSDLLSSSANASFGGLVRTFNDLASRFLVSFDTLREAGVGKTLADSKVTVAEGHFAWIFSGESVPVASRDSEQGLVTYNYVDTGVILVVSPHVGEDDVITLWIKPELSNISDWVGDPESSADNAAPIIDTREVLSELRMFDGQEVSVGGLIREDLLVTRSKVPVLGDLPLVGSLFRKKREETERSELVVFLTPHILSGEQGSATAPAPTHVELSSNTERDEPDSEAINKKENSIKEKAEVSAHNSGLSAW